MRFFAFIVGIGWLGLLSISPVHTQTVSEIQYEVIARLEIPGASGATWNPDGSRLAVTTWPTIQIWDTERWELLTTISDAPAFSTKWSPSGDMLAGVRGGFYESVLIWNAATGEVLKEMMRQQLSKSNGGLVVHDLAWSPDSNQIVTDAARTDISLLLMWDLNDPNNPQPLAEVSPNIPPDDWMNVAGIEWSQNGRWLLTDGSDGNFRSRSIIRLFDAATGKALRTIFPGFNPIWGPNDERFAGLNIKDDTYVINIWDVETEDILYTFDAHENGTSVMSWNFPANVIAGVKFGDHLVLWDVETGLRHDISSIQTSIGSDIEWRPNSNQLAIADLEHGVVVLDFDFGR